MSLIKCPECNGSGYIKIGTCHSCSISHSIEYPCETCENEGKITLKQLNAWYKRKKLNYYNKME